MRRDGEKLQRGGGWSVFGKLAAGGDGRKVTVFQLANDKPWGATAKWLLAPPESKRAAGRCLIGSALQFNLRRRVSAGSPACGMSGGSLRGVFAALCLFASARHRFFNQVAGAAAWEHTHDG